VALTAPPPPLEDPAQGVIEEARRRQRHRRGVAAGIALAATLVVAAAYIGSGAVRNRQPTAPRSLAPAGFGITETPDAVFVKDPYMGVSCHLPNSIACDRVGLAVWLRHRAVAVSATIAGAPLKLNDPQWSYTYHEGRRRVFVYAGFLQPAGIISRLHVTPDRRATTWIARPGSTTWIGSNAPTPTVQFRIDYGHGRVTLTEMNVSLEAGWG
jgi:hypothetical protein